ncbi:helix-turn-helix transcriptional regulator [Paenibacillus sp. sgz500958]|uniref:helix-turn-helix transcriptional regulator n=1 Tax=Paenibacillus sp. sgz500958 TaxID=3242475 RepID=UPI0036D2C8DB
MRADRLLTLLLLLQTRGKMTSKELAELLETSERTIFRDMEALSAVGIPVLAERGRQGGWMLTEGYRTSLTGMKPKEMASLLLSADPAILKDLGIQEEFMAAAQKLDAASSGGKSFSASYFSQRIHVDGEGWLSSGESFPYLSLLQDALWEDRKVNITYHRNGESKERLIGLLGLVVKRGVWYAVGLHDDQFRSYRVSRILNAVISEEVFVRPDGFDLPSYWESSKISFKSTLPRYQANISIKTTSFQDLSHERYVTVLSKAESTGSGWVNAEVEFNTQEYACRILLSYGPNVIINSPDELHAEVLNAALQTVLLGLSRTIDSN